MVVVSLSSSDGSSGQDGGSPKDRGSASTFSLTLSEIEGSLGRETPFGKSSTNVNNNIGEGKVEVM